MADENEDVALHAVQAGLAMLDAMQALKPYLETAYGRCFDVGIGIHFGEVVIGSVGAIGQERVTAIGDADKKLATWGPQLKKNGPQTLADVVMPEAFDGHTINLEGHTLEVIDANGLANRRYLWVSSLNAIFGGVLVFSGTHVWTADTANAESRALWLKNLDAMAARKPVTVIPGHIAPGSAIDVSALTFTREYLVAFDEELGKAANSADLIAAMTQRYPNLGMGIALQIGAKVAKGEMKWG